MDVVLLTQSNYRKWRSCMESYLISEDLWDTVCGTVVIPPGESCEALKQFKKKNAKASFSLKRSISDDLFDHIIDCDSATSIWETIDTLFKKIEEDRMKNLEKELAGLSLSNQELAEPNKIKEKEVVAASAPDGSQVDKNKPLGDDKMVESGLTDESSQLEEVTKINLTPEESKMTAVESIVESGLTAESSQLEEVTKINLTPEESKMTAVESIVESGLTAESSQLEEVTKINLTREESKMTAVESIVESGISADSSQLEEVKKIDVASEESKLIAVESKCDEQQEVKTVEGPRKSTRKIKEPVRLGDDYVASSSKGKRGKGRKYK